MKKIFLASLLIAIILGGCAIQPLDAPCDPHATLCGQKIAINQ